MPEVTDIYAELIDVVGNPNRISINVCSECGFELGTDEVDCAECGTINLIQARVRAKWNRPSREVARIIESSNYNGKYTVYKNSDGTFSCDCLSFLFQRGIQNSDGFSSCKHIRTYLEQNPAENPNGSGEKPSTWQVAALKRLGVAISEHLTNAQAYFVFNDLLTKQGVTYKEYRDILTKHKTVNLLPIYSFGIEFEGFVEGGKEALANKFREAEIPVIHSGYNHDLFNGWKIGSDGSVHGGPGEPMELVSPKLFGADGFTHLKKVLKIWHELGGNVNRSCGTHVHIDAWDLTIEDMIRLAKIWAKIEVPMVWYLVSPSRRDGEYCKSIDLGFLFQIASSANIGNLDRYRSLNLSAFAKYKTIEFRIHNGTSEAKKIISWIIFLLKLVEAAKKGLTHRDIEPSFEGVMDAIGMNDTSTTLIRDAKRYLWERFQHWKLDAMTHPVHVPVVQPLSCDDLDMELERMVREERVRRLRSDYMSRHHRMTIADNNHPSNHVQYLASMTPSNVIAEEHLASAQISSTEAEWDVPAQRSGATYRVTLHDDETLSCDCRKFRVDHYCYHSINVARYLVLQRQLEEVR